MLIKKIYFLLLFSLLSSQGSYNLYSPYLELPTIGSGETMHFGFYLYANMPDSDGNEDGFLEDYYSISINNFTDPAWHSSNFNLDDGANFWCADGEINGYKDGWIQYLDTPSILVGSGGEFSSRIYYVIEDATGPFEVDGSCTNGWDAINIRISSDGGSTWALLEDSLNPYDFDCGYGWIFNNDKYEAGGLLNHLAKGWGDKSGGWLDFSSDLTDYAGENVIIRFAFGSDPAWSTVDDNSLTGFQVDDILVEDDTGELFSDSGDDMSQMRASGAVWEDQFYDYGSVEIDGEGNEYSRPGASGWEFYWPGMAFVPEGGEANVNLDISNFAEKTIQFRIQSRYDDNHDGGQGGGLFIDNFVIYKFSSTAYDSPVGLIAELTGDAIILTWDDMNVSGSKEFIFDNDTFDYEGGIRYDGWAGKRFDIFGNGTINTVSIYNVNESDTTISFGVFAKTGALFDLNPIYLDQTLLTPGWNEVTVTGWDVENSFIVAHEVGSSFGAAYDSSNTSLKSYLRSGEGAWYLTSDYEMGGMQLSGEYGIRTNITYEGADVTYNIYRDDDPIISGMTKIANGLDQNTYTDANVVNNVTYEYAVSATYPDGGESAKSDSVLVTLMSSTVHELYHDDGTAEVEYNVEENATLDNFSAVKFTASESGEGIVRFKWYQNGSGGVFYIKIWDDAELFEDIGEDSIEDTGDVGEEDGVYTQGEPFTDSNGNGIWDSHIGLPGNEIYSKLQPSGNQDGWNDKDLSSKGLNVSGDFWIGVKEMGASKPFGLDTDDNSGFSYKRIGIDGVWTQVEGDLMYRVYLDSGESAGRVVSSWGNQEEKTRGKYPIYTLKWDNKRLRRVPLLINEKQVYKLQEHPPALHRSITATEDTIRLWLGDFEAGRDTVWSYDAGWNLSTENYVPHSPIHSINSPNSNSLSVESRIIPNKYGILEIFPNPFNPNANIQFKISERTQAILSIYDLNGRLVNILVDDMLSPGYYTSVWNGVDINGYQVSSGIYFSVLAGKGRQIQTRKLVLLK